jgi:hypothetical protein
MKINNPSPSELKAHQIAYYTQLLKESNNDGQKRFLRTQLYNLKKSSHVSSSSFNSGLFRSVDFGGKIFSLN